MPAYPITARAAVNAAGEGLESILDAIDHDRTALAPCTELGDPPPRVGWLGSPAALPEPLRAHDGRATRVLWRALAPVVPEIDAACRRWGASRVGAVIAAPLADPLYPQQRAELMAGRIALGQQEAAIPDSLRETVIGPATALEIGWTRAGAAAL